MISSLTETVDQTPEPEEQTPPCKFDDVEDIKIRQKLHEWQDFEIQVAPFSPVTEVIQLKVEPSSQIVEVMTCPVIQHR